MKVCTMMVGLPRSGKSTYIKNNFNNIVIVSADQLRLIIYGQRFWKDGENIVWSNREIILKSLLEQGLDIIIDETNISISSRKNIIDLCKRYNYVVNVIFIYTYLEVCIQRAIESDQDDLIKVIGEMSENFEIPCEKEGIDNIKIIKDDSNVNKFVGVSNVRIKFNDNLKMFNIVIYEKDNSVESYWCRISDIPDIFRKFRKN